MTLETFHLLHLLWIICKNGGIAACHVVTVPAEKNANRLRLSKPKHPLQRNTQAAACSHALKLPKYAKIRGFTQWCILENSPQSGVLLNVNDTCKQFDRRIE